MFMHTRTTSEQFQAPPSGLRPSESGDSSMDDVIKLKGSDDLDHFIPVVTTLAAKRSSGRGKKRTVQQPETKVRKEKKGKGVSVGWEKVGGTVKLSDKNQKSEHLVESVDGSSSVTYKEEDDSSIAEVMKAVQSLPGVEPGSKLWLFATQLFISEDCREMFVYMKDPSYTLQWLNYMFARK